MSKFTVMYKSTNSMYLNVEADSLETAMMQRKKKKKKQKKLRRTQMAENL